MKTSVLIFIASVQGLGWAAEPVETVAPGWFVFAPSNALAAGAIGLGDWLDVPAGRHGPVGMKKDRLVFADGTEVKFWGVNNFRFGVAPTRPEAEVRSAWYAKYGVNIVRRHKFGWRTNGVNEDALGSAETGTQLVPELLDRMDCCAVAIARDLRSSSPGQSTCRHLF